MQIMMPRSPGTHPQQQDQPHVMTPSGPPTNIDIVVEDFFQILSESSLLPDYGFRCDNRAFQELFRRLETLESSNQALKREVDELRIKVVVMEGENGSLKQLLRDNKDQAVHHHPSNNTLHAELLDLKNKQEEIKAQQAAFKQETETHINSWAQVARGRDTPLAPPLAAVEEVVQSKLMEERTRQARELNLKVRGLPLPLTSSDPMVVGTLFLNEKIDLRDVTLDRAWLRYGSSLFLRFRLAADHLRALRAKRKLFSLTSKIFLDEDLTKTQVVELKCSTELVTAACQAGKWAIIRNLKAVIQDTFPPGWKPRSGSSK